MRNSHYAMTAIDVALAQTGKGITLNVDNYNIPVLIRIDPKTNFRPTL